MRLRPPLARPTCLATVKVTAALMVALLSGCSALPSLPSFPSLPRLGSADDFLGLITPYRIDIVQGNVVTKEQLALLKPGLTRNQVRDILGSPMVTDPFHADRWDYIFTIRRPGTEPQRRSVVVLFEGEGMKSVQAPDLPSEREFVASISRPLGGTVPKLALTEEERKALPLPPKREAPPPEAVGPVREYPPLEPT